MGDALPTQPSDHNTNTNGHETATKQPLMVHLESTQQPTNNSGPSQSDGNLGNSLLESLSALERRLGWDESPEKAVMRRLNSLEFAVWGRMMQTSVAERIKSLQQVLGLSSREAK